MPLVPKPPSASATEMVQVVLPNDANPMGFMLGGAVMHLIDIAAAIAAFRHARELVVTAAVDGLEFLNPIKVGDFIVLKARVTAVFTTSLEVEVTVFFRGGADGPAAAHEPRVSDVRDAGKAGHARGDSAAAAWRPKRSGSCRKPPEVRRAANISRAAPRSEQKTQSGSPDLPFSSLVRRVSLPCASAAARCSCRD